MTQVLVELNLPSFNGVLFNSRILFYSFCVYVKVVLYPMFVKYLVNGCLTNVRVQIPVSLCNLYVFMYAIKAGDC